MEPRWDLSGCTGYDKGRSFVWQVLWQLVSGLVFVRWWCPAGLRVRILRAFGAEIGEGVYIKPRVRVHWPWRLKVGDHSWIGEDAWILNLVQVSIGSQSIISQSALLCSGSHDMHSPTFELDNAPITIGNGTWIAARATVLRGVTVGDGAVVGSGALVVKDVADGQIVLAPVAEPLLRKRPAA